MKRSFKLVSLLLILCLVMSLTVACGSNKETGKANNESSDAPKKVVELKFHYQDPQTGPLGRAIDDWAKQVNEKTNGAVKITPYPSATLGPGPKGIELTSDGVADISWGSTGLYAGRFPVTDTLLLPMLGVKTAKEGSKVAWDFYKEFEGVKKEWDETGLKLIGLIGTGNTPIGTLKEIKTLDDFKGLSIRTIGGAPAEFFKAIGASPVIMPPGELYQSMEKRVLDGWAIDWQALVGFKLNEITPYILELKNNTYLHVHFIVMNKNSYEKIPEEYREVFDSLCGDYLSQLIASYYDASEEPGKKATVEEYKNHLITLPDEEEAKMVQISQNIQDEYAKQLDEKGLKGTEALAKVKELVQKHKK